MSFTRWCEERDYSQSYNYLTTLAQKGGVDIANIDMHQLLIGFGVEKEHDGRKGKDTNVTRGNDLLTLKIAVAHLREQPQYYTKLIGAGL